jgi:hypothetical protein
VAADPAAGSALLDSAPARTAALHMVGAARTAVAAARMETAAATIINPRLTYPGSGLAGRREWTSTSSSSTVTGC